MLLPVDTNSSLISDLIYLLPSTILLELEVTAPKKRKGKKRDLFLTAKPSDSLLASLPDGFDSFRDLKTTLTAPSQSAKKSAADKPAQRITSTRGRKMALIQETLQAKKVMSHPAFQANPLATLKEHLKIALQSVRTLFIHLECSAEMNGT